MVNVVPLVYTVDRDRRYGKYMAFLHPKAFKRLKLPYTIKDEISSLSATYPWALACECKGNVDLIHIETYFFESFQRIFKEYWDYSYGIPSIYFKGKIDLFMQETREVPIFLLTIQDNYVDPLYQYTYWEEAVLKHEGSSLLVDMESIHNLTMIANKATMKVYLRNKMLQLIQESVGTN